MRVTCPLCAEPFDVPDAGNHACPHCRSPMVIGPDGNATATAADPSGSTKPNTSLPEWAQAGRGPTPWERRGELGLFTALYQTIGRSAFRPQSFWSTVDPDRPWSDAFWYAWIITVVGSLLQAPINIWNFRNIRAQLMSNPQLASMMRGEFTEWFDWLAANSVTVAFGMCAATIVLFPLTFMLGTGVVHLGCMLFGCANNGFEASARVMGYATTPALMTWLPQVGGMVGLYVLILQVWGLTQVQETTFGRAVAAVLVIPIATACCLAPVIVIAIMTAFMPAGL